MLCQGSRGGIKKREDPVVKVAGLLVRGVPQTRIDMERAAGNPPVQDMGCVDPNDAVLGTADDKGGTGDFPQFVQRVEGQSRAGVDQESAIIRRLSDGAEKIDLSNLSEYDQACVEEFQNAMKNYFDGNASKEDALAQFYKAVGEKHPELAQ